MENLMKKFAYLSLAFVLFTSICSAQDQASPSDTPAPAAQDAVESVVAPVEAAPAVQAQDGTVMPTEVGQAAAATASGCCGSTPEPCCRRRVMAPVMAAGAPCCPTRPRFIQRFRVRGNRCCN